MTVSFSITRSTTRFHDSNGNGVKDAGELDFDFGEVGVYDPGDILYTRISITNTGDQAATGVTVSDNFAGSTFVNASNAVSGTPFLNISPIASNDTFEAIGNTVLRVGTATTINGGESSFFAGNLLSNDVGSLAGDNIPGFQIDAVTNGVSANGGRFNIFADGTFNYVNDGTDLTLTTDSFSYKIRDVGFDGVINTADDLTSTATVTITFATQSPGGPAHRVWYVDSNAAPGGDGTSANPFQTMAVINGVTGDGTTNDDRDQTGEYIYVENGGGVAVTGPITLETGQQLIGKGAALTVAGVTLANAGTNSTLNAPAGTIVTLASGNTIAGLNIGNGTGTASGIAGTSFGTLTVDNATIDTVGSALNLTTGAFAGSGFTTVNSDGGTNNVSFVNVTGTVALGSGALTGASGASLTMVSSGAANGLNVTYSGSVTQGNNAALVNVDGGTNGHTGTLTLSGTLNATNGTGLQFSNADGTYNLSGNTTLNGGDAGIDIITGSGGSFTFGNAGVTTTNVTNNSGGDAFVVNASNATILFNGTITDNNGNAVAIDGHDGGTATFQNGSINSTAGGIDVINSNGGAINFNSQITLSTGANTAITLTANNGSATNFNPTGTGLDITTSSGSGIAASNAGTITIADSGSGNTINVTAGSGSTAAFSATGGTTIAAGGVTFDSISQTGGTNAIVLNGTGTAGGFAVLGNGATGTSGEGTGGTIQNTSGDAIVLSNAAGVKLNDMVIGVVAATAGEGQPDTVVNIGDDGITMTNVTALAGQSYGLVLDNVTISRTGGNGINGTGGGNVGLKIVDSRFLNIGNDLAGTIESAIDFGSGFASSADQISGTVYIDRTTFAGFTGYGFTVENAGNGTLNMTVDNSVFKNNDSTGIGDSGIQIIADGSQTANNPKVNLLVEDTTFTNIDLDGIEIFADPGSTFNATIRRTTHSSPNGDNAIHVAGGSRDSDDVESMTVLLEDNNVTAMRGSLIFLKSGAGNFDATITGGTLDSGDTDNGATAHLGRGIELLVDSDHDPSLGITGDATHTKLKVDNVTIRNIGVDGIHVGMNEIASGSTIDVSITNSSIGSATAPVGRQDTGEGIEIIAHDVTMNLLISGNTIFTRGISGTSEAIDVDSQTQNFTATVNATITNNHLNNINLGGAPAANNLDVNAETASSTVRLDISGNFSDNGPIDPDYQLANSGTFTVKGAGVGAASAASIAATQSSGTASVSGTINYNNNAAITQPTAPGTPTLPPAPPANLSAEAPPPPVTTEDPGDGGPGDNPAPPPVPGPAGPVVVDDGVLSQAELDLVVEAAIQRWVAAGATDEQVAAMRAVHVSVADLAGLTLGASNPGSITLDNDAAGWRWFVDSTPGDDSEYAGSGTKLAAVNPYGMAGTRIDLLTVITHELGHQIGLEDLSGPGLSSELMYGTIGAGERRLPGSDDLSYASGGPVSGAFAFAPVSLGTLPAGQTVIIEFRHVIDTPSEDRNVGAWTGQTIVDSDQTAPQMSNAETGNIDGLALGDFIFNDVNRDGDYDAGTDTVAANVSLTLYADTNNDGNYDEGTDLYIGYNELGGGAGYQQGIDTPAAPGTGTPLTVTTNASGIYSFAGLAPGDYIVRVNASNFQAGGALFGKYSPGNPADPNANISNDNNGEQFLLGQAGTYAASRAIRLDYGLETVAGPTGPALDTNDSLDLGFVANVAPVANADSVSATEDVQAQYSTELTGNDTDADPDTLTITGVSNFVNGTASVTSGIVTFTPTTNFNGTASFDYTISDGNGHTATATATVTVGAVNDPVTTAAPANATLDEDAVDFAVTGLSIADVDANLAPAGVYEVVLSATQGTLKLTTITGLTFTVGDGDGDSTMTFHGTLAAINTALATAKYSPTANYNGSAQIQLQATDVFGVTVATGTGAATNDSDTIAVTVNSVNDAPVGANQSSAATAGVEYVFSATDFSENFSDPVEGNGFAGIRITSTPATGTLKLNGVAISVPTDVTLLQLTNGNLTYDPGTAGTSPTFQFRVRDDGGTANGGQDLSVGENVYTVNIAAANAAPALDLDADGGGTGYSGAYTEGGAAAAISDTDVLITDADSGDNVEGATITITNAVAGDVLTVVGTLPGSITVDAVNSTATTLILTGTGTQAEYEAAIEQITFSSTSDNPTALGTNNSRTINVTVTDGDATSNVAVATISVADDNADAPSGTSATITAIEDTFRLIGAADLGFNDVDGTFASVEISAVTGGGLYYDADGTAGAGAPVLVATLPQTYTAQDLIDGKVSFLAAPNANGTGLGTITFAVRDDDGNVDGSPNVLTIDVTAVNDSPELTTGGPIAATEQTAVAILPAGAVSDVDLDALNSGDGDYAGASFSVNRNPATNTTEDVFTLVAGPNFTIDGSDLKSGGQVFGTISVDGSAGLIVINFTSSGTTATSALVDEVIQSVRYTNTSDNPPASVVLAVGFTDGSPGGSQGAGATGLDVNLVTVNISGVNDAPVNSLGGTIGTGEDAIDAWLSGMSISDPDADPATDDMVVTFSVLHGTLDIRTDVLNGVTAGDVTGDDTGTITVTATLNEINATLAASNGLTYSPTANYNGDDTLTVTTNDQGANGSDPGLTGDGTSEQDSDTRTISVSAVDDAPVAQPDAVSTPENVIGTGSLFANNGSGPDSDVEGDSFTVTEVNGSPLVSGSPIVLASGAILIVNSDGTYSYNPNGKFNRLTDNSSGAVNTSQVGDTFSYTISGGNTVSVTVTVNGVAGPGDWLMGDGTDNTITGTPQADTFVLSQGGDDTVTGLGSDDIFYFGGALTSADNVTGGAGVDTIVLQGNYSGLTLDSSVTGVERISMLAGTNTAFGDPGTNLYDYVLTIDDANFLAGEQVRINGGALLAGEDFTFDGSAETDAKFVIYGGKGTDNLTGGDGNDIFFFAEAGRFAAGDVVNGGDGYDGLFLRGNYTIDFTQVGYAGALQNLENLTVSSASDERYGRGGGSEFDYDIVWDDDLLAAGLTMTISGALLTANETFEFDGSDESDGAFRIFSGAGDDLLIGGDGADVIMGGLGFDTMYGGAGNDTFRYDSIAESFVVRDGIQDFATGDLVDLSRIDANSTLAGNQAFTFIGSAAFGGNAGELRFADQGGGIWLIQGDTDGNQVSDFEFFLITPAPHAITSADFIL